MNESDQSHFNLVGGFNPSEKYQSIGIIIPNIWKNKKCSKQPTGYVYYNHNSNKSSNKNNNAVNSIYYRAHVYMYIYIYAPGNSEIDAEMCQAYFLTWCTEYIVCSDNNISQKKVGRNELVATMLSIIAADPS